MNFKMDQKKLLSEIEELAGELGVKLYDVTATLPDGSKRIIKVVADAYELITSNFMKDYGECTFEMCDELANLIQK